MSATITTKFRLENASTFIKSVADESIYLMLGKSDAWSVDKNTTTDSAAPTPRDVQLEENDMWQNAIALKKLGASDAINVAPRWNWTSGTAYVGWDDAPSDESMFAKKFYVLNQNYDVFKCLKAGSGNSTYEPTNATSVNAFKTTDGYIWKYMGKISTPNITKFMTNAYMPVKTITLDPGEGVGDPSWDALSTAEQTQYQYQLDCAANTAGKIYCYIVTNGGSGYTSAPDVIVYGNGTGAQATAVIDAGSGTVTEVYVTGELTMTGNFAPYNTKCGSGYTSAYVTFDNTGTGGSGAAARAVLSPKNGHGTDQTRELGGFYVETNVTLTGAEGTGDFITGASFRQIALIKNPLDYGTPTISNATTRSALKTMILTGAPTGGPLESGDYITGAGSNACAFVDSYALEDTTHIVRYHQNDKTGYLAFAEEVINSHGGQSATIASGGLGNPEVQPVSGDIMFIENRAPISRSTSQIEDIRLVIEF